ncbi:MAG TPA: glycosyltransferase family 4 protein [Sphingomonas sp.]|nr:glycosyltransferase family 4 protein [Sphingomonas sp.]
MRNELAVWGTDFHRISMGRASINPLEDSRTRLALIRLFRDVWPDIILAYMQKPIVYAGLAHRWLGRGRFFAMVTGFGYVFSGAGCRPWLRRIVTWLYCAALARATAVIVYNRDDRDELRRAGIVGDGHELVPIPGSGVDMAHFAEQPLPPGGPTFLVIARLLHDKGLREYVEAGEIVRRDYPDARFELVGPFDPNPAAVSAAELAEWQSRGALIYHGSTRDVRPYLASCSVFVLPSHREGLPRTILEAMATGRAIITTDAPGCRETVCAGENGVLVPVGDAPALAAARMRFCREPALAERMGVMSRRIARRRFAVEAINRVLMATLGLEHEARAARCAPCVEVLAGPAPTGL